MPASPVIITDGSIDFSGGVNSIKTTTIQSERNPNGLARNELAWLDNATVRDGGITCRGGFQPIMKIADSNSIYQGKFLYQPSGADPYFIYSISGHIILANPLTGLVRDLTAESPSNVPQFNPDGKLVAYFVQAEQFLVIQAGDSQTLPFIWDGQFLRRSLGITNPAVAPGTPGVNEIPAATAMDYFMGRIWYARGRTANAGDIVNGPSGTAQYQNRDSVLNVTENPMVLSGDGFTVPTSDGTIIRAIKHSANIDAALGQGRLFIGTRKAIYALNVPVTRSDWISATNSNQPLMTVVQLNNGWVNDRSVVAVNGDLFSQSLEPGIRSLNQSTRFFGQWGNIPISANENRILQFNDRSLLRFSNGIYFDNRLIQSALPMDTSQGVVHQAMIPLDFTPISGFNRMKEPNWEGMYEGIDSYQMEVGDFGGRERAFATIRSKVDQSMNLWEMTSFDKFDNGESRIVWIIETPAYTWGNEMELKRLVGAELWIDRLFGTVQFVMEYRPDGQQCWIQWHAWKKCSTKNSTETVQDPYAYPLVPCLESYFATMTLPKPPEGCSATSRISTIGYQFQVRLIIKGFCRVRGIYLHAEHVGRKLYENLTC
jgi:hypothetical protein